jgi:adenine-specific DNA-methyltransferase
MKLQKIKPSKALNKAYYKQSLTREQMELFKKELQSTFNHIDEKQDEEYHKNIIADLFKNVYCKGKYLVNVNKKEDLVIRLGNNTKDEVGVLLEFKKPTEKRDMVSAENANVKALQEIVLYYLRQTIDQKNHKITNLVVTNIYEWFIFDGVWFEKNIFRNTKLKKDYLDFKTSGHDTKYFYDNIAAKHLTELKDEVSCTYFNLLDYKKNIADENLENDEELIDLYKILSPEHLLNKKFANDSNSLNTDFYNELLYIIGLEESKDTAKKTIRRINEAERNDGSLIENTISKLKTKKYFGYDNNEETENQYYEVALELCITWLNRILFLKLLESQLVKYHRGDKDNFAFLTSEKINDFDELEELFFEVLAQKVNDRNASIAEKYKDIPYLNSSLFEMTDLEKNALSLSNLKDRLEFHVFKKSVLKKVTKEEIKPKTSLKYLLEFLDAYNFASESNAKIQEENKSIINASVLGLIFEKINGYKDGSFFTPGFITMYMCRETIRKAVVEKFKTSFPYCQDVSEFEELKDKIDYTNKAQRQEANKLINDIKIVDPAVGSGHFLVSALNEMIAIKSDLQILSYQNGNRVLGYTITLDNDELITQNQETDKLFEYTLNQNNKIITDLQDLQEVLFHEKQTIIENCLFGVDINPKSVMICQLRLWIELLKNAYYTKASDYKELQTLPNIDINIKSGNSLISKFAIKDNVFERITGFQKKLQDYKNWVHIYKQTNDKKAKDVLKNNLKLFKAKFKLVDLRVLKLQNDLRKLNATYYDKYQTHQFFQSELTDKELKVKEKLEKEINDKQAEIQNIKDNPIYANAFEWRFEFPEVLDDNGNFVGFDVVIGNPPYVDAKKLALFSNIFKEKYKVYYSSSDLSSYFFELAFNILSNNGLLSFINTNKFFKTEYGKPLRNYISNYNVKSIINFEQVPIFDEALVSSLILVSQKNNNKENFYISEFFKEEIILKDFRYEIEARKKLIEVIDFNDEPWNFSNQSTNKIIKKLYSNSLKIKDISSIDIKRGVTTGYDPAFIVDNEIADKLNNKDVIKPLLKGRDVKSYSIKKSTQSLIVIPKGYTIKSNSNDINIVSEPPPRYGNLEISDAYNYIYSKINNIISYLNIHQEKAKLRTDKGDFWWELRACDYYNYFEMNKIVWPLTADKWGFALDTEKHYLTSGGFMLISNEMSLQYILGVLNSNLMKFLFSQIGVMTAGGAFTLKKATIDEFPIKTISKEAQQPIISLVDQILSLKKENPQAFTSKLEEDIDKLVYQLYELTDEEIEVVKNS